MKKPQITKGEWETDNADIGVTMGVDWWVKIATCHGQHSKNEMIANIQAISAVPEMIDALIQARGYIQTKVDIFNEQYPDDTPRNALNKLEQIEQALIKAGCTE